MEFSALPVDLPYLHAKVVLSEFEKLMFVTYIHVRASIRNNVLVTCKKYEF